MIYLIYDYPQVGIAIFGVLLLAISFQRNVPRLDGAPVWRRHSGP